MGAGAVLGRAGARLWRGVTARGSLGQDIAATALGNGLVFGASLLAYGLAARRFGEGELGQYMLLRRVIMSLMPVVMLGMPVALSRQLALSGAAGAGARLAVVFTSAVVGLSLGLLALCATAFPSAGARFLLGDPAALGLLSATLLWLAGAVWSQQLYALYMGRLQARLASAIQACTGALAPLLPFVLWPGAALGWVLAASGWLVLAACALFTPGPLRWALSGGAPWRGVAQPALLLRALLGYGLSRVPGFAALAGLWTITPLLLLARGETQANTYVMAGIQALLLVSLVLQPISTVLLPRVAELAGAGRLPELRSALAPVQALLLDCGIVLLLQVPVAVPLLSRHWLLLGAADGVLAATIVALAVPACMYFNILRNPIDAISATPYNTYNLLGALALQLGLYYGLPLLGVSPLFAAAWAISLSFALLGLATWAVSRRLFQLDSGLGGLRHSAVLLVLALALCGAGLLLARGIAPLPALGQLAALGGFELGAAGVSFAAMLRLRTPWALALYRKFPASSPPMPPPAN